MTSLRYFSLFQLIHSLNWEESINSPVSSRHGEPAWETVTSSTLPPRWAKSVEWAKADILQPSVWKPFLKDASAVIHSMGILLEADYKGILQGKGSIVGGLQTAFASSKLGSGNSLRRSKGQILETKEHDGQLTYELMNRDSGSIAFHESYCLKEPELTQNWLGSGGSSARSCAAKCLHLRVHICRRRGTAPSPKIYHHEKRG